MICRTCLQRPSFLSRTALPVAARSFSTTAAARSAAPADAQPAQAQADLLTRPGNATAAAAPSVHSSCPAGTVLNGLNYFKGGHDPVAKPDAEYPAWLWSCLEVQKKAADEADEDVGDEFSKSKKQRRLAAKRQRQLEAQILASGNLEALAPKIPLQQQSINLPISDAAGAKGGDSLFAVEKREELRKAMRKERKARIKESNYLKSM